MSDPRPAPLDYALLTVGAANFAMSFLLTKIGLVGFPPILFVALRLAIASLILWAAMKAAGAALPPLADREAWWLIAATALFGNALPFALITWGQVTVPASTTAILVAVMPLTTVVLAHFIGDERMTLWAVIGCVLGLAGVSVLMGRDAVSQIGEGALREWAVVGAAVSFAVNAVLMRRMAGRSMRAMSYGMILVAFAMLAPVALVVNPPETVDASWSAVAALVAAGIFPTAIGTLIIINITKRAGAPFLSQINFLVPVFGVAFAAIFLGESIEPRAGIALALVLAGIAVSRIGREPRTIARGRA